jgi:hypothetical protein
MSKHLLKFYPVDNGDNTLITLSDKTSILIDCKIREGEETDAGNKIFPVKDDLIESIQKNGDDAPFVDLFIITHPDEDHCLGFKRNFFYGKAPGEYDDDNKENEEIIINELWCSTMLFNGATNDDAKALKKEAERRRKLWEEGKTEKNIDGNRIRMIGYDGDNKFENVPASVPGDTIELKNINGKTTGNFEFFVHSPFKNSLIEATAEEDKNFSSVAMQARFKINKTDSNWACYYLFGGDADHNIWEQILNKSEENDNEDKLKWDIFLSPHHCSWTFFNDVPYDEKEENKTPKDSSLKVLDYKEGAGKIIASCKVVRSSDKNPPHAEAKKQYQKKLDKDSHFIEIAKEPKEKEPKTYVFEVTPSGPVKEGEKEGSTVAAAGGASTVVNKKSEYGSQSAQ